jgi:NAD-dependent SIR2 family protein deacetylase
MTDTLPDKTGIELPILTKKCIGCGKKKGLPEFRIKGPCAVNTSKWCHECATNRAYYVTKPTSSLYGKVLPERNEVRIFPRAYTNHRSEKPKNIHPGAAWCSKCGETKSKEYFNKDSRRTSGHQYYCRECTGKMNKTSYRRRRAV